MDRYRPWLGPTTSNAAHGPGGLFRLLQHVQLRYRQYGTVDRLHCTTSLTQPALDNIRAFPQVTGSSDEATGRWEKGRGCEGSGEGHRQREGCVSVCFSARLCVSGRKRLVGARRTEPTWVKEWYPLETAAGGMSPPGVGSKMQDYDHWDALVIGEWPPGRSGPPLPFPYLWYFSLSLNLSPSLSLRVSVLMSCAGVGTSSIFHSRWKDCLACIWTLACH